MSISNKLKTILSLQSIAVKVKSVYKNIQKVFDAGKNEDQWIAYCLKTGEYFELPEGMTEIPLYMFDGHTALKGVSIPAAVTNIGEYAFNGSGVQIRQFPEALETIGAYAFYGCNNDVVVFSPSIAAVDGSAFEGNENLTEVTFVKASRKDETIKSGTPDYLDEKTFANCPNLTTIRVPWGEGEVAGEFDADGNRINWGAENATVVHNFWDTAITSEVFTFPQGFIKIPDYLFYSATKTTAKEIYIGDECEEIGEGAFYSAKNLETVHMPEGLTKIGMYGFRHCSALNCSELPDSVEEIANRAFHGSSISLTKLPTNIKELGIRCFQGCSGNMFTEIPEGVELIASGAFLNNTGLTKLYFTGTPMVKKVTNGIANNAFEGCTNLIEIYVPWSEGEVAGEFDEDGNRINWGAENATVIHDWRSDQ